MPDPRSLPYPHHLPPALLVMEDTLAVEFFWRDGFMEIKLRKCLAAMSKYPLHLWDIQDDFLACVKSVGVYAIHEHAYLGVVINSTVSIFHKSIGNNMLALVPVHKLLEDESSLSPIIIVSR